MKLDKRKEYIDLMKGAAMLLVIITHILPLGGGVNSVLSNLHNSTFYFASGLLFLSTKDKLEKKNILVKDILLKKFYKIVYPCIVWTILYSLLDICLTYVLDGGSSILVHVVLAALNRLWFLPVLFLAFLFICVLWSINVREELVTVMWIGILYVCTLYSSPISKILFCSFLVWLGTLCANIHITFKMSLFFLVLYVFICYFAFFSGGGYFRQEDGIQAGYKLFLLYIIATIGAFTMWCTAWLVAGCINKRYIAAWTFIGENSIYFYIMHYFSIYCFEHIEVQSVSIKISCFILAVLVPLLYIKFVKGTLINKYLFCIR